MDSSFKVPSYGAHIWIQGLQGVGLQPENLADWLLALSSIPIPYLLNTMNTAASDSKFVKAGAHIQATCALE
eukprot:1148793-Pelagomonas_calceolata.AAC.1